MDWEVVYSKRAEGFLLRLDSAASKAIFRKISSSKSNPYHFFMRMVSLPYYRMRVGDYRVIAEIQDTVRVIAVIKIGHRKNVYDK